MRIELESDDFNDVRDAMMGVIDFEPTDEQIREAIGHKSDLLGQAAEWGWNDTEVRSEVANALGALERGREP